VYKRQVNCILAADCSLVILNFVEIYYIKFNFSSNKLIC
jgi:hypothetical protein